MSPYQGRDYGREQKSPLALALSQQQPGQPFAPPQHPLGMPGPSAVRPAYPRAPRHPQSPHAPGTHPKISDHGIVYF